jgi:tRNA (cmo5U34)-methyltransferase
MTKETFSFDSIQNFDSHLLASVPNYDVLFNSLLILSDYFVMKDKTIYDVGCSTGKLISTLDNKYKDLQCKFVGLDRSLNLLPQHDKETLQFICTDLNKGFSFNNACLVFSIFTLQFLDRDARQQLISNVYDGLNKGGAFIVTEKVYCESGRVQDIFTSSYYDFKKQAFSEKQILDKEVDLRKILKPNTTGENIKMLENAGFNVHPFYQYLNFVGYLCLK